MYKTYDDGYLSYSTRSALIEGYTGMIEEKMNDGYIGYHVNFMFNQLPGKHATQIEIMKEQVQRLHSILTRHIVRKPDSILWKPLMPFFIGCPDLSVPKEEKKKIRLKNVNDGLHFNGLLFVPPKRRAKGGRSVAGSDGRQSRLRISLKRHFKEKKEEYLTSRLCRVYLTRIRDTGICDYTFKAFKAGKVLDKDILVL